ncbi:multidrug ABC transporter permease [candidate division WOR-1 bacterium RIFCSPLOWO2_02_FULL_46_20]|uniref:Transport permease protein n=2 Tax=Saganbacteria TaxID=1703751 RepID=A0A1F4RC76_UNCSA|nr:MAG: multidrug ABC transporter permease [candidate division WOR-1 bacterium RIFCSPHIGHO2_02_FULL_45_12]OGC05767.1 MAG: multidrug ABC transporter permease [candidate division WOR-1 bacterium RIFCSPLOWO2_02_FULL_46_20]OGC10180.1 MAG: multidrug ABC transporter permease [candidate division WOR-1 bacterium RIFCSPLOWO2_12_FULL_45_9]
MVELRAIYILWLREVKKFLRAKERIIGSVAMPVMFMMFFGFGFSHTSIPGIDGKINYIDFLVPGMIGMNMLFSSMFAGISVLWDKEFGFLKEIMVAPVSRVSIALGRIAGGATTGLVQGLLLFIISFFFGFRLQPGVNIIVAVVMMIIFMTLIAFSFLSLGLSFATNMRDAQGFELIINFVMFPLFFLSGAVSPISNLPIWLRALSYANPLTYGVDGLRSVLVGASMFSLFFDLIVCSFSAIAMVSLAAFFFERSESI